MILRSKKYQCDEIFDRNQIFQNEKSYNETETFQEKHNLRIEINLRDLSIQDIKKEVINLNLSRQLFDELILLSLNQLEQLFHYAGRRISDKQQKSARDFMIGIYSLWPCHQDEEFQNEKAQKIWNYCYILVSMYQDNLKQFKNFQTYIDCFYRKHYDMENPGSKVKLFDQKKHLYIEQYIETKIKYLKSNISTYGLIQRLIPKINQLFIEFPRIHKLQSDQIEELDMNQIIAQFINYDFETYNKMSGQKKIEQTQNQNKKQNIQFDEFLEIKKKMISEEFQKFDEQIKQISKEQNSKQEKTPEENYKNTDLKKNYYIGSVGELDFKDFIQSFELKNEKKNFYSPRVKFSEDLIEKQSQNHKYFQSFSEHASEKQFLIPKHVQSLWKEQFDTKIVQSINKRKRKQHRKIEKMRANVPSNIVTRSKAKKS